MHVCHMRSWPYKSSSCSCRAPAGNVANIGNRSKFKMERRSGAMRLLKRLLNHRSSAGKRRKHAALGIGKWGFQLKFDLGKEL